MDLKLTFELMFCFVSVQDLVLAAQYLPEPDYQFQAATVIWDGKLSPSAQGCYGFKANAPELLFSIPLAIVTQISLSGGNIRFLYFSILNRLRQ